MTVPSMMSVIDAQLATIAFDQARIAYPNVTYTPVAGRSYLRASIAALTNTPLTLGFDRTLSGAGYTLRWDGVYEIVAVWPENAGADGCYQMQQTILRLFPRGLTLNTSDGLHLLFELPSVLPLQIDGAWIRGPVRCPWWCLETS